MDKIKSKNITYKKNIKEKNEENLKKLELKNLLIEEIDKLSSETKRISKELIDLSNNLEINKLEDVFTFSNSINEMIKISMNNLNNRIEQFDFLKKKRSNNVKEDKKNQIHLKICEFKNQLGNIIGYNLKSEIMNIKFKFGPWNNLEILQKIKNKLIGKFQELKLNQGMKKEEIDKFYEDFKNKIYIKYPPIKISEK